MTTNPPTDTATRDAIRRICEGSEPNGLSPDASDVLRECYLAAVDGWKRNGQSGAQDAVNAYLKLDKAAQRAMSGDPRGQFPTWRADRILDAEFPDPIWAIPGLLPIGMCILAGRPKVGKSWLALQIAQAVATGGRVLGQQVERGPVLYLALEDPPRRLQQRMTAQNWPHGTDAEFMPMGDFNEHLGDLRGAGGERLAARMEQYGYRLVVIDTLSRAISGDQNPTDEMTRALAPIQAMAHANEAAILLIDHHGKGIFGTEADAIRDIMGSTAKGAAVDTSWGLYRERGKAGAKLQVVSREFAELTLALHFDGELSCWQSDGDADELALTEQRRDIIGAVQTLGVCGVVDIAKAVGIDKGNTYKQLQDMVAARVLRKYSEGRNVYYALPN